MKKLTMKFYDVNAKKNYTVNISDFDDTKTQEEIQASMDKMIGVLVPTTAAKDEALITDTNKTEVFNLIEN
ncbi:hypothetical protein OSSY52_03470 [Tepiditoga spiralis]|uniref:DUF2922 domain-containing protein n=1 Tax=Tepiditoga spiralis TaxID=2108365 RepID=A0A7G1G4Q9_9BACT|nr:DUF2922 family protein [Tepiditoga spiralis]BBE30206.1 hypothetical protein OSSY52_03470 [Tepiditoga spiralis]